MKKLSNHPNYGKVSFNNDIAVLELEQDLNFSKTAARPACLPTQPLSAYLNKKATIAGYGDTSVNNRGSSPILQILSGVKIYEKCPQANFTIRCHQLYIKLK